MMPRDCCRVTALQCWLMPQPRVIVIGAGIGGLTAAALLAAQGCAVTVLERAATPGGKLRQVDVGGALIDAGPTVFTMRWVFDEIFENCGFALDDYLTLTKADILARHAWSATERLDLFADEAASADAIGIFAGASEARGFLAFMTEARRMLSTLDEPFLRRAATGPLGLTTRIGIRRISDLIAIHPYARLWDRLGVHFKDDRLRQLFGRYATYSGSSPFASPATLSLIAAVEAAGVWLVDEGNVRACPGAGRYRERIVSSVSILHRGSSYCTRKGIASLGRIPGSRCDRIQWRPAGSRFRLARRVSSASRAEISKCKAVAVGFGLDTSNARHRLSTGASQCPFLARL